MTAEIRNNPARDIIKRPLNWAVDLIEDHAAWLSPDVITIGGIVGQTAIDYLIARSPGRQLGLTAGHGLVNLADVLDGEWARRKAERQGTETTVTGALLDSVSDRYKELSTSLALAVKAKNEGDNLCFGIHLMTGLSSGLPSLLRARAETQSVVVAEGGLGTYPIRVGMGIGALATSDRPKLSQTISMASLAQNVFVSAKRYHATKPGSPHAVGRIEKPEEVVAARRRYTALKLQTISAAAITAAVAYKIRSK